MIAGLIAATLKMVRNTKLRITKEHFIKSFGEHGGTHLYRKYLSLGGDILEFFNQLDTTNSAIFCELISEIGE